MKQATSRTIGFTVGFLIASSIVSARGFADRVQLQGSACLPAGEDSLIDVNGTAGFGNRDTGTALVLACPVPSDDATSSGEDEGDAFDHKRVTSLSVHVLDQNDDAGEDVEAYACILYASSAGGACGSADTTSGTGYDTLTPDPSVWTAAGTSGADYPALFIVLPHRDVGTSRIMGYRVVSQ